MAVRFSCPKKKLQPQLTPPCHGQLILLTGLPTSGKTTRASQLLSLLTPLASPGDAPASPTTTPSYTLTLISEHSLHLPRSAYAHAAHEKDARAALLAAVQRALAPRAIVLVDAACHIKGWRYQLHCEAKAAGVRSCVVHVGATVPQARAANDARLALRRQRGQDGDGAGVVGGARERDPYDPGVWDELAARYEEPNPMARWDSPLFTVARDDAAPPHALIWAQVVAPAGRRGAAAGALAATVRPHQATVRAPASQADALYELDRATQAVVARLVEHAAAAGGEGGAVTVPLEAPEGGGVDETRSAILRVPVGGVGFAQLQRLRRQFIASQRQQMGSRGGGADGRLVPGRGARLFVDWLNDVFDEQ